MSNQDQKAVGNKPTVHQIYLDEIRESIQEMVLEVGMFRRMEEEAEDQEIRETITGIIQTQLTLLVNYRRELQNG